MIAVISVGDSGEDRINAELAKFGINRVVDLFRRRKHEPFPRRRIDTG